MVTVSAVTFSQGNRSQAEYLARGESVVPKDVGLHPESPTRRILNLSGDWKLSLENTDGPISVSVPGVYTFTGKAKLSRTFDITRELLDDYAFSLVAYGINNQADISINGSFIGRHVGGYASFILPIPAGILALGRENVVSISVDNELTPTSTLPLRQPVGGWKTYGGIFRDIYLLATPRLNIEDAVVTANPAPDGKTARVVVHTTVRNLESDTESSDGGVLGVQVEVLDKSIDQIAGRSGISPVSVAAGKSINVRSELSIPSPRRWSPDSPSLYTVSVQLVRIVNKETRFVDVRMSDIGVRDVRWREDGRVDINGVAEPLRGILWQEDHPSMGSALSYEAMEHDVRMMKEVGVTLVRFLYPPHPYMLDLCDRYGLFVIESIPAIGVPEEVLSRDHFQDLSTSYLREMVQRDKQHPSVLAWGIGDEFEMSSDVGCDYVNAMRNVVKSMDDRPVYYAATFGRNLCQDFVDLIAVNTPGNDPKEIRAMLKEIRARYPEKPIIVARYGSDVQEGNRQGYSNPISMEAQARSAVLAFEAIREAKVAGSVLWSFSDWRTDRPAMTATSRDPYLATMGIVNFERERRTAYDAVRAIFNGEKVQALPVGNYSPSAPMIFVVAGLVALIAFAFVYNGNRRFRDSVNRSLFHSYNFFADIRDQRFLSYLHSLFLAVVVSVTGATVLASILTHYRENILLDNLLSQLLSDRTKEWLVYLVWKPAEFIAVVAVLVFVKLLAIAIIVRAISAVVKTRVQFYHALSVTTWATLPCIAFIPVAMILYRLMETPMYVMPVFVLLGLVTLWAFLRLLKGISIIYDVFFLKVYAIGFLVVLVATIALYGYLDYTRATSVYLKHMVQTVKSSM
jgi:hypothetical protein